MAISIEQVYEQIDEQRAVLVKLLNQAKNNPIAPNKLSDVCMKLAILNELLGGFVADLKQAQLLKEQEISNSGKALDLSATAITNLMRTGSIEERYAFDKADIKHSDLWKLISMAQSHIRSTADEMKGNFQ
jgi:hypothetical protein